MIDRSAFATEQPLKTQLFDVIGKPVYSSATHLKICTFSSQKEYILLGRSYK